MVSSCVFTEYAKANSQPFDLRQFIVATSAAEESEIDTTCRIKSVLCDIKHSELASRSHFQFGLESRRKFNKEIKIALKNILKKLKIKTKKSKKIICEKKIDKNFI